MISQSSPLILKILQLTPLSVKMFKLSPLSIKMFQLSPLSIKNNLIISLQYKVVSIIFHDRNVLYFYLHLKIVPIGRGLWRITQELGTINILDNALCNDLDLGKYLQGQCHNRSE